MRRFFNATLAISLLGIVSCGSEPAKIGENEYLAEAKQLCPPRPGTPYVNKALDEYIAFTQCYVDFYEANIERVKVEERWSITESHEQAKPNLAKYEKMKSDKQARIAN